MSENQTTTMDVVQGVIFPLTLALPVIFLLAARLRGPVGRLVAGFRGRPAAVPEAPPEPEPEPNPNDEPGEPEPEDNGVGDQPAG